MKLKYLLIPLLGVIASFLPVSAQTGAIMVAGTVMTDMGEELIGASVYVKENPGQGVVTDLDGKFRVQNLAKGVTLVVSYIGYENYEMKVTESKERLRIVLEEIVNMADELVVVGRGTQRKISVVGAVTNIKASDLQVPATSVTNMMGGRIPGIISVTRSGEPGNDFSEFWVRGISTFGAGSSALVLIDGIEGNLNDLDPADIETFTVLKDASSTAVYGVRGANGVVLVETKKGKAGKLSVSVKSNISLSHSARMPEYVDAFDYVTLANEAAVVRGMNPIYDQTAISLFRTGLDPDLYPNVNWRKVILKDYTWNHQHHLSASGGGENARYYLSMGIQNKEAVFKQDKGINKYDPNVNYNKYNFRANVDVNLTRTTILALGLESIIVSQNSPGYGDDNKALWQAQANLTPVTVPVIYSTGDLPAYGAGSDEMSPYVQLNHTGYKKYYRNTNNLNLKLIQDLSVITEGLEANLLFSLNSNSSLSQRRTKTPDLYYAKGRARDGNLDLVRTVEKVDAVYSRNNITDRKLYFEGRLNYQRVFKKDHRVSGLAHFYMEDYVTGEHSDYMTSIPKRYMGFSGRATYSYKDTYLLEGNIGYTGSEAFQKGSKYGTFPAISMGWVPSQYEWFQEKLPFIDFLKFRGSVGLVGNDRLTNDNKVRFPYLTTMTSEKVGSGVWNSGSGVTEDQVGTDNLVWEKSKKYNLGVDVRFFKDRFDLTVDVFKDIRSGIFQQRASVPEEMGLVNDPWANVGKMKSWGTDGTISYTQPFANKSMLTVRANFTYADDKILSYEESGIRYPYQSHVGYRYKVTRGLVALGLFKDEDDIASSPRQTFTSNVLPGDIKYKDVNGDGIIDEDDMVPLSYSETPRIQYGFALEYLWKNWSFSAFFEGVAKVNYFYGGNGFYPFANGATGNVLQIVADQSNRWTPASYSGTTDTENPDARFPRLSYGSNKNNNRASTFWLANGNYLRFKNVQVSYELKTKAFRRIGLQSATISAIGENLHCWDKIKLWDPAQASDNGAVYPLQRIYTLQVNLRF